MRELDAGRIVVGGCVITGSDPQWQCTSCDAVMCGKKKKRNNDL